MILAHIIVGYRRVIEVVGKYVSAVFYVLFEFVDLHFNLYLVCTTNEFGKRVKLIF